MLPMLLNLVLLGLGVLVADNPYNIENGLTPGVIAGYVRKAGFPVEEIPEAVRIVLLESKGQPDKLQDEADDPAIGLFQIDLKPHWDLNGEENPMRIWFKQRGVETREDAVEWLKDPLNNAEAAFQIWKDRKKRKDSPTGWEAWSAYNAGNKPENREQEDWDIATNAMQTIIESMESEKEDMEDVTEDMDTTETVEVEDEVSETNNTPVSTNLRQTQQEAFRAREIEQRPIREMTPRQQEINDIFIKLFASLRGF